MKGGMSRMPAVVEERFRRLVLLANLYILMFAGVVFAEMSAQTTLPVVNLNHSHLSHVDSIGFTSVSKLTDPPRTAISPPDAAPTTPAPARKTPSIPDSRTA
jgi:hypothetical protein